MDKDMKRSLRHGLRSPHRQRGAVMVLVTAGLIAIIAMAGLALDMGHSYLSKTRLQNALDATALSGAKTLFDGLTTADAETAAVNTFNQHPDMASANLTPVIQFSSTLIPFSPGATEASTPPAKYVRARVDSYPLYVGLTAVLGVTSREVAGTAVSGPVPVAPPPISPICNLAPILMCGDKDDTDKDCSDGGCYGYHPTEYSEVTLKTNSQQSKDPWEVGPGNFQLLDLGCPESGAGGAACVRENLAKGAACVESDTVPTKPGNSVGPVEDGFNTRFGMHDGTMKGTEAEYPPDLVTYSDFDDNGTPADPFDDQNNFWYDGGSDSYEARYHNHQYDEPPPSAGYGEAERRILTVPIGDCTGTEGGKGDVPVLGYGCFYMTRPASHKGNTQAIFGELIGECKASGYGATAPPPVPSLPSKLVLFKDPDTNDS